MVFNFSVVTQQTIGVLLASGQAIFCFSNNFCCN